MFWQLLIVTFMCVVCVCVCHKLHSLYRSGNKVRIIKSRRLKWAGHVVKMEEGRSVVKLLTGKPTGRLRYRRKDNIAIRIKDIGVNTQYWIGSTQDRYYWKTPANVTLNLRFP